MYIFEYIILVRCHIYHLYMTLNVRKCIIEHIHPAKIQISLRIRAVWSESSLCTFWIDKHAKCLHADKEDLEDAQIDLSLRWAHRSERCFFQVAAYIAHAVTDGPVGRMFTTTKNRKKQKFLNHISWYEWVSGKYFSYYSTNTYVVGTHKKRLGVFVIFPRKHIMWVLKRSASASASNEYP